MNLSIRFDVSHTAFPVLFRILGPALPGIARI